MYYEAIFKTLSAHKVDYLIAGGMAVNLYGVPRFTKDLDIMVEPSPGNLERLRRALVSLNYKPKIPVSLEAFLYPRNWEKWKKEKGMVAFSLHRQDSPFEEIDLLIDVPVRYPDAKKRETILRAGSLRLHLVSINDLITMKKKAGRQQDLSDIEALNKVKRLNEKSKSKKK